MSGMPTEEEKEGGLLPLLELALAKAQSAEHRVKEVFSVLDGVVHDGGVAVAYSGGKDSTALLLLLLDWAIERGVGIDVEIFHSDTLSEVPEMEQWARSFAEEYLKRLNQAGCNGRFRVAAPQPQDTFYWRVLVKGYAAPTYKWRWCVKLLKRRPLQPLLDSLGGKVLLLGHRDAESRARAAALSRRLGVCPLRAGACTSYYLQVEGRARRVYPLRNWNDDDVWSYLLDGWSNRLPMLTELFRLYGDGLLKARFGCWHCTVAKVQLAHIVLGGGHLYFEAVRLLYRWLSDTPELREEKSWGYSRLGPLKAPARALLLHAMLQAERLSGLRLYGLDEARVAGFSLRELFLEASEEEADRVITSVEKSSKVSSAKIISVSELRELEKHKSSLEPHIKEFERKAEGRGLRKPFEEILGSLI